MPKRKKNRKHSAHVPTLKPMNAAARTALMIDRQPDINAGVCIDCHEAEPVEGHHRCLPCFEASYHRAPRPKKHKKRAVPTPIPRVSFFEYAGVRVAIPLVRGKSVRELPVYVEGKRVGAFTAFDTAALGYPPGQTRSSASWMRTGSASLKESGGWSRMPACASCTGWPRAMRASSPPLAPCGAYGPARPPPVSCTPEAAGPSS